MIPRKIKPMLLPELKGKVTVVTGGANWIGAALVEAFHRLGTQVCFSLFLDGHASLAMTGQELLVDRGWTYS